MLHSRKNFRAAVLDTHILKFLRESGVKNVPDRTPSSKKQYKILEDLYFELVGDENPAGKDKVI